MQNYHQHCESWTHLKELKSITLLRLKMTFALMFLRALFVLGDSI